MSRRAFLQSAAALGVATTAPLALGSFHAAAQAAERYDYIVVGAGAAGCALAARLSEDPAVNVLVLEAGPPDDSQLIHTPATFPSLLKSELDWDLVAISTDGGSTWTKHSAPGNRNWQPYGTGGLPRWVEPVAWDSNGALYYLWSQGRSMHLGRSTDLGASWDSWEIAADTDNVFFPYLVSTGTGDLAATWFAAANGMGVRVAQVKMQASGPSVVMSDPLPFESWAEAEGKWQRDTAGEYAAVMLLTDGNLAVVTPLQDPRTDRMGFSFWRLEQASE